MQAALYVLALCWMPDASTVSQGRELWAAGAVEHLLRGDNLWSTTHLPPPPPPPGIREFLDLCNDWEEVQGEMKDREVAQSLGVVMSNFLKPWAMSRHSFILLPQINSNFWLLAIYCCVALLKKKHSIEKKSILVLFWIFLKE